MPEDDVGLDAELLQIENPLLEVPPESRVRAAEIELAVGALLKGEQLRLIAVVDVRSWERRRTGSC